ncbi:MAG: SseB family protein [Propionicimonas sp.]
MTTLGRPSADYAGDHGEPDPTLRTFLARSHEGRDDYLRAVAALCGARLLLPIVARGDDGPERHAEMVALTLTTADGRVGLPVFTGLDALSAWRSEARPVPCRLDEVAASALDQGAGAILIDLAGPAVLVIETDLIGELARRRRLVHLDDGGWGWLFAAPDSPASG